MSEAAVPVAPEAEQRLVDAARQAQARAYCPYSHYPVGAAILTGNGDIVSGANVENASYGLTICAERAAVFTAVSAGQRAIRAIAIVTPSDPPAAPCGACRQVLREFAVSGQSGTFVLLADQTGAIRRRLTLDQLLPDSFGPADLPNR